VTDLEDAATDALEEARGLSSEAESAVSVLTDMAEEAVSAREEVASAWDAFAGELSTLLAQLEPDGKRLAEATQDALTHVGEARTAVEELRGEAEAKAQESSAAFTGLGEQAEGLVPGATTFGEHLDGACDALVQQAAAIGDSLDEAIEGARQFLADDIATGAESMATDLGEAAETVIEFLEETAESLEEAFATWDAGLAEAEAVIEQLFGQLDEGMTQSVDEAARRAADHYDAAWAPLLERAARVEAALGDLAGALDGARADAVTGLGSLGEGLDTTAAALEAADTRLAEIRALLASYTFVQG
jgi:chromosome segregation ATPase